MSSHTDNRARTPRFREASLSWYSRRQISSGAARLAERTNRGLISGQSPKKTGMDYLLASSSRARRAT